MMVVITLLLASTFAIGVGAFSDDLDADEVSTTVGGPWSGSQGDLIRLSTTRPGATGVSVRVNFTIEPGSNTVGNSLNSVYIDVTTGSPDVFSTTTQSDLDRVVIDADSDGDIDQEITGDVDGWQVKDGGSALKIGFSGSAYTASENDSIIIVFHNAQNPETTGTYDVEAQTSGDGNWHYGTLDIVK